MRFVDDDTVKIPLTDDPRTGEKRYIEVKKELNAKQHRKVFTGLVKEMKAGEKMTLDPERIGLTKILAYLEGWSAVRNGKPVKVTEDALDRLSQEDYTEIYQAIEAHDAALDKERADQKNTPGETPKSEAISPSAD